VRLTVAIISLSLTYLVRGESVFHSKPTESVLLLDQHTIVQTTGLKQEFFPARKYTTNPVLRRSEPWEGVGPYVWGTRLMQDATSKELRLWYTAYSFQGNAYRMGLATAMDGLHWTKAELNLAMFDASPARNWLPVGSHADKGVLSIARDPRSETSADRRFLGIRFTYDGEFISFSPDGIRWKEYSGNPVWHVPSDIIHLMWDERRNHFVAYYKVWEVKGIEIRPDGSEQNVVAFMPSFDQKPYNNLSHTLSNTLPAAPKSDEGGSQTSSRNAVELTGPRIFFLTNGPARVENCRLVLRANQQGRDDGGGSALSGDWTGKRVQAWAESNDGIHWSNERVVLRADEQDPPAANIQYMFVMQYGGYYVGFLTLHDERGLFSIELAWSEDGLRWNRSRQPWLEHGPKDAFDSGMVLGPTDPVLLEHEMIFPYGGFPITHDSPRQDWEAAIGLATMRLDGFVAWRADKPGVLVTQPFVCDGDELFVNADEVRGAIRAEVLEAKGRVVKGFETLNCNPINGSDRGIDTLQAGERGWISWRKATLSSLRGQQIQLRFLIDRARIYSFRIATSQTRHLPLPRATTL
jgi:hypothetical protein